jgi:FAD:protein FMN transferase
MVASFKRRRFLTIAAASSGLPLLRVGASATPLLRVWRGVALGADAVLQVHHPDPEQADRLIAHALDEVRRLERILSLYDPASALVRLNREGELAAPPFDLVRIFGESARFHRLTGGAFDVSVQPLWDLYASHFGQPDADPAGPSPAAIASVLPLVGQDAVELSPEYIRFTRRGMTVTLNGIGQGYVTDRVVERLREGGVEHALVDMGETRAIGGHPLGGAWSVGLEDPATPARALDRVDLIDRAIATSGGYGTEFDPAGRFNHIFDPKDGSTSWRYASVSVVAGTATEADALSTAFCLMPLDRTEPLVHQLGLRSYFVAPDRQRWMQGA